MRLKGILAGKLLLLPAMVLSLTACSNSDSEVLAPVSTIELRLMETTDIHANLVNFNYFTNSQDDRVGLVKTATLIKAARAEATNSLLVDNGDLIQGSPLGDYIAKVRGLDSGDVHPVYQAMNLLDYDVANIGNHEFNFGLAFLDEAIDDARFPYTSANVFKDDGDDDSSNDEPYFAPYVIQDKEFTDKEGKAHTLKVGFIGFVPPQIMQWDRANLDGKVIAKDIIEMAERYVPQMKDAGADLVIAIPHSGLSLNDRKGLDENATYYLSRVDGIDAILFGHAHRNFPGSDYADKTEQGIDNTKGTINGIPAVMPGFWGNHLGVIDLTLESSTDGWRVVNSQSTLQPIFELDADRKTVSLVETDQEIRNAVDTEHRETLDWVNEPFARISAPINSFFALVQDDPSIQVVTDAQAWYTRNIITGTDLETLPVLSAGAPFRAGRGGSEDFTNIPSGDIAYRNVADLYIYPNILKVLELSGAQVREWLERSAGQFNQINPMNNAVQPLINNDFPSYNFDAIDGVNYEIDITQPARYALDGSLADASANRIINLTYNGNPIDSQAKFLVVTNNYRAGGGGNFPEISADKIVIDSPNENRQVVADYLLNETNENPSTGFDPSADKNWKFATATGVTVSFYSSNSDEARAFAATLSAVTVTGNTNAEGFAEYQLSLD